MTSTPEPSQDVGNSSSEIALDPYTGGTVGLVLQRVVALAVKTIAGCDACGILFLKSLERTARAFRDPILADVDTLQIRLGQRPCLDAIAQGGTIYAADLADDPRWPTFAPMGEVPDAQRWGQPDDARDIADGTSSGDRTGAPGIS